MSASKNPDSVANQPTQFTSHIPPSEPLTTKGHKPGVKVGNDAAPEFHAKTLPPGTAPKDRTFAPNPIGEIPSQANNDLADRSHGKESTVTSAESTLGGATSADVHQGLGKPLQGQTKREQRDGWKDKAGTGIIGRGASGAPNEPTKKVDERVISDQRGLGKEEGDMAGKRSDKADRSAADMPNEPAESVAAERS
ncbi:MAG: hypothetical protein Q9187_007472 [Circinaria calcarea]